MDYDDPVDELGDAATVVERQRPRARTGPVLSRGIAVGRFVLLDVLGEGGMGIVYSAYDPQLDRRVAIKLLVADAESAEGRVRLLREAQAMAKINHPNVVTVHEAGAIDNQIYVAMEFCDGGTLRDWVNAKPRTWREIVDVFTQAGRGLAAAHEAGLVHRDFKPHNVLMAHDAVVRVSDFGLAGLASGAAPELPETSDEPPTRPSVRSTPLSQQLTRTGAVMGTPAYMSPEQFAGAVANERTDQFSFCVALYEALYGALPFGGLTVGEIAVAVAAGKVLPAPEGSTVPSWLRAVVVRGLSTNGDDRYASMRELLAALGHDPRARRRRFVLAGVIASAVVAGILLVVAFGGRGDLCGSGAERRAAAWNGDRSAKLHSAFAASGRSGALATFDKASAIADRWSAGWERGYRDACEATQVRGDQSAHLLDLRMDCLNRRLSEAAATIDTLSGGSVDAVDHAIDALVALPSLAPCADATGLLAAIPPPDAASAEKVARIRSDLDHAGSEVRIGHSRPALDLATKALVAARASGYPPLVSEALLVVGGAQHDLQDPAEVSTLREATHGALRDGATGTFIDTSVLLVAALIRQTSSYDEASEIAAIAGATVDHARVTGEPASRIEAAIGLVALKQGHVADAQQHFERELAIARRDLPADHPAIADAMSYEMSALTGLGKFAEAEQLGQRAVALREETYGKDHLKVAQALNDLAIVYRRQGKLAAARRIYERVLTFWTTNYGADFPDVGTTLTNMCAVDDDHGDTALAIDECKRALALLDKRFGTDSIQTVEAVIGLGVSWMDADDFANARSALERGVRIIEAAHGHDHPMLASPLAMLGAIANSQQRYDDAGPLFQRAIAVAEKAYGPDHPDVADYEIDYAITFKKQHRYDDAIALLRRALPIEEKAYGANHVNIAKLLVNLAHLQEAKDDIAGALASYTRALAVLDTIPDKDAAIEGYVLSGMAGQLVSLKRAKEAMPLLERALAIRSASKDDRLIAETIYTRALAHDALHERTAAVADARTAIAEYQKANDPADAAEVRTWLAHH